MKKSGKSGRPGKRRRNMPGYYLGVNKIGHKAWRASRRPEDIDKIVSKRDFLNGTIEPGSIFALSKTSNAIFLGVHRGRVLYYNPKTDRVGHTGFGRFKHQEKPVTLLKEKADLEYFKSENNWMNHRKIPGSDLKVSDVLLNPYRKTIAKKVGDEFTMLDYHESAVVGDVLLGGISGLKAEVTAITKRGMAVKVDDGTPNGKSGFINLKNPAFKERMYSLVKSAVNEELEVKDLQKKFKKDEYESVETENGGTVAVSRGRPAGSTNKPLTEEEKQGHRKEAENYIEKFNKLPDDDTRQQLSLVKKIISHSNKAGDEETNKKFKKLRQQLNYKIGLQDKYDEAETPEQKIQAAKAALKYEERIGGRDSAIKMWKDRIDELSGKKDLSDKVEDPTDKKIDDAKDEIEIKPDENSFDGEVSKKIEEYKDHPIFKKVYEQAIEGGEPLPESFVNTTNDILGRIIEGESYSQNEVAKYLARYKAHKELTSSNPPDEVKIAKKIKEYQNDPAFIQAKKSVLDSIKFEPHIDYSENVQKLKDLEREMSLIAMDLKDENKYTPEEYKEKLARYKAIKTGSSLFNDDLEFFNKIDKDIEQYIASGGNSVKKQILETRKLLRSDYTKNENSVIKTIKRMFATLKENEQIFQKPEDKEKNKNDYLIVMKAAKEAFNDKKRQSDLKSEAEALKNDKFFNQNYEMTKKSLKNLSKVALIRNIDATFNLLADRTNKKEPLYIVQLADYKAALDLMTEVSNDAGSPHKLTIDKFLPAGITKDDSMYPYYVNMHQKEIARAVEAGLEVDENIKKTVPRFNSWVGDKVDGQEIRKRLNSVTVNTNWLLSQENKNNEFFLKLKEEEFEKKNEKIENSSYQVLFSRIKERSDRLEQEIINLRKKLPPPNLTNISSLSDLFNEEPTDEEKIINKEISLLYNEKRYLSSLLLTGYNEHADAVKSEFKNHLDSSPQTKFKYTIEFNQNSSITEEKKQSLKTKVEKSMDFVRKMLCERNGEFIVSIDVSNATKRENFQELRNSVQLNPSSNERTIVHEVAHKIEYLYPEAKKMCIDFVKRRTEGESIVSLKKMFPGSDFKEDEMTRPDKFISPYIGKLYNINGTTNWSHDTNYEDISATEVLSMGMEAMFDDPLKFANLDPEHFDLIWKIMRGGGQSA